VGDGRRKERGRRGEGVRKGNVGKVEEGV